MSPLSPSRLAVEIISSFVSVSCSFKSFGLEGMSSESELQLLKDAGWSPGSLAAALSPEKENVSQNVPSLSSLPSTDHAKQGASFLSPLRSSKVSKKASESPMQVLARTLGLHSFLRADEQRLIQKIPEQSAAIKSPLICTPQMRYADKKSTPSPSRFIDLTGCDFNVPTPKKQILTSFLSKFQSAKSIYQQEAQCVSPPQTKHIAPALISKNEYQDVEAMLKDARLDDKLPNGWTLFPHQKEAVEQAIKCRRCILAYDMGLGKTIISLKWAEIITRSSAGCLTIVVAPCTLLETWRREALMLGFIIVTENDKISLKKTSPPSVLLVSWNKIPSPSEVLSMIPHSTGGFTLIGDESHAMQNMTSQRTRAALDLCMHSSCIGCILATGTPMKNGRPSNILPLLVAIRHPIAKNRIEFEKRYCNARRTKFCAWDTTGCSHLEELRSKVGVFLMRKTKEECLELPLLGRVKVPVEVSPKDLIEYDNIIKKIKSAGMRKGLQSLYQQRADSENNPLTLLSTLRMLVSKTKVSTALLKSCLNISYDLLHRLGRVLRLSEQCSMRTPLQ